MISFIYLFIYNLSLAVNKLFVNKAQEQNSSDQLKLVRDNLFNFSLVSLVINTYSKSSNKGRWCQIITKVQEHPETLGAINLSRAFIPYFFTSCPWTFLKYHRGHLFSCNFFFKSISKICCIGLINWTVLLVRWGCYSYLWYLINDVIMKSYYNVIYLITLNYFSLSHYQLSLSGLRCWNCLYWRALYICIMPSTEAIVLLVRHDSGANNNNSWLAKTVQSCQHILFNSC